MISSWPSFSFQLRPYYILRYLLPELIPQRPWALSSVLNTRNARVLGHARESLSEESSNWAGSSNSFLHLHERSFSCLVIQSRRFVERKRPICIHHCRSSTCMDYSSWYVCAFTSAQSLIDPLGEQVSSYARPASCLLFSERYVSQKLSQRFSVASFSVRLTLWPYVSFHQQNICRPNRFWSHPRIHRTRFSTRVPSLPQSSC